jgi:hypothetical protein
VDRPFFFVRLSTELHSTNYRKTFNYIALAAAGYDPTALRGCTVTYVMGKAQPSVDPEHTIWLDATVFPGE